MGLRDDFLRRIQKKQAEIAEMKTAVRVAEADLVAWQDAYRLLPKDGPSEMGDGAASFRRGSGTGKAYDALKRHGKPMHISDLTEAIGKKATRPNTQGLASSLRMYVNKNEVFTKPAPNTYGLVEWGEAGNAITVTEIEATPDIFDVLAKKGA